jgi:hypothetical protein
MGLEILCQNEILYFSKGLNPCYFGIKFIGLTALQF